MTLAARMYASKLRCRPNSSTTCWPRSSCAMTWSSVERSSVRSTNGRRSIKRSLLRSALKDAWLPPSRLAKSVSSSPFMSSSRATQSSPSLSSHNAADSTAVRWRRNSSWRSAMSATEISRSAILISPAVLGVHIEDQVDRGAGFDHTAQDQSGEKALAGAGLAEDAVRALDEAPQIQAYRHIHVDRLTDLEVVLAVVASEHTLEVGERRFRDAREVGWNGARRPGYKVRFLELNV